MVMIPFCQVSDRSKQLPCDLAVAGYLGRYSVQVRDWLRDKVALNYVVPDCARLQDHLLCDDAVWDCCLLLVTRCMPDYLSTV